MSEEWSAEASAGEASAGESAARKVERFETERRSRLVGGEETSGTEMGVVGVEEESDPDGVAKRCMGGARRESMSSSSTDGQEE